MKNFKLFFGLFMLLISFGTFLIISIKTYENSENLAIKIAFIFPVFISIFLSMDIIKENK